MMKNHRTHVRIPLNTVMKIGSAFNKEVPSLDKIEYDEQNGLTKYRLNSGGCLHVYDSCYPTQIVHVELHVNDKKVKWGTYDVEYETLCMKDAKEDING